MAEREIVVNLRVSDGNAKEQFRAINSQLVDLREQLTLNRKALRENGQAIRDLDAEFKKGGITAEQYAVAQQRLITEREGLKTTNANLLESERRLAVQFRELRNEVSGATENQLRFRDVLANATIQAFKQSGVLGQLGTRSEFLNSQITELRDAQSSLRSKMDAITEEAARQNEVIGSLASRSDALRSEMDALNTEYERGNLTQEQYNQGQAQLTAELNKVQGEIGQTNTKLDQLNAEYQQGKITQEQYAASQAKITVELNKVQAEIGQTNAKVDLLTKEFQQGKITADQFRAGISDIGKGFDGIGGAINKGVADLKSFALGFVGVIAVAQGAIAAIRSIAGTIADFDQQLANIRALGQEYAASIDQIADAAVKLGPRLGIAPVEALKAFEELAKAGLTTQQILTGGLESALNLAATGTLEVGAAAELTASTLTQFNLAGKDAGLIADLLAKGANIAQGGVGDLGAALNQSGLVASQFGLSVEETVGALTLFANAGLTGSDAGTSFRSALLRLQNPTKEAKTLLEQYGVAITNTEGEFLSLSEIANNLQTGFAGLTEEQRGAALATIFGQDAIRVANILYREGGKAVDEYTKEVNDAGFAARTNAERQDSLSGSLQRVTANWEAFVLSLEKGDGVIGTLIKGSLDALAGVLGGLAGRVSDEVSQKFLDGASEFERITNDALAKAGRGSLEVLGRRQQEALGDQFDFVRDIVEKNINQEERLAQARANFVKQAEALAAEADRRDTRASAEAAAKAQARVVLFDKLLEQYKREEEAQKTVAGQRDALQKQLDAEIAAQGKLNAADTEGLAKSREKVAELEKQLRALKGTTTASEEAGQSFGRTSTEVANVAGSVADLNAQIAALRASQQQATTSEQFATYQTQIDALSQSVDLLTGKLSQDFVDAANAVPTTQPVRVSTAPLTPAAQATPDSPEQALQAQAEQQAASLTSLEEFYIARDTLSQFYSEQELARKEAELAAEQGINDAKLQGAQILAGAIASIAQEGSVAARVAFGLQKALAVAEVIISLNRQIAAIRLAADIQSANLSVTPATAAFIPVVQAAALARIAQAKIQAGLSVAQIVAQGVAGFDKGGIVSGERVRPSHGRPIRRSNGDNRLVTVKTGEVVMNEEQQEELRRRAGSSIFRELGIPGFATGGTITRGTALVNASVPIGLGPIANRVLQVQTNEANQALAERPIFVRVEEINKLQGRVAQVTELSRA